MAYTYSQLEAFWDQAGGDPNVAPVMAAVAEAESSGENVIQKGQPYDKTGWGLWQITPGNSEPNIGVDNALLDPLTNAKAAVAKYKVQGLNAWTTYTKGTYKQYLQAGVTPASDVTGTSAPSVTGPTAGSAFMDALVKGMGVPDVKDLAERLALIVFGVAVLVVGIIHFSGARKTAVKVVGSTTGARKTALKTTDNTAGDVQEKVEADA